MSHLNVDSRNLNLLVFVLIRDSDCYKCPQQSRRHPSSCADTMNNDRKPSDTLQYTHHTPAYTRCTLTIYPVCNPKTRMLRRPVRCIPCLFYSVKPVQTTSYINYSPCQHVHELMGLRGRRLELTTCHRPSHFWRYRPRSALDRRSPEYSVAYRTARSIVLSHINLWVMVTAKRIDVP